MISSTRDKQIYELALSFLSKLKAQNGENLSQQMLNKYFQVAKKEKLADIYLQLLISAQNAHMKAGVIGRAIGGVEKLHSILCDFDPKAVLEKFDGNPINVFNKIKEQLNPHGQVNEHGLWEKYCTSIISGAKFLAQFSAAEDFYFWAKPFTVNENTRLALPLLLQEEINGFGLALACDFLKDIGFSDYPKPDVQLRKIFSTLDLCTKDATDFELLKAIIRVAKNVGETPYKVDAVFWLIGSGNFYHDNLKIPHTFENFIVQAKTLPSL